MGATLTLVPINNSVPLNQELTKSVQSRVVPLVVPFLYKSFCTLCTKDCELM